MTYGTHVQVYELGFAECSKSYVFKGSKEYTPAQVAQQLGIVGAVRSGPPGQPGAGGAAGDHTSLRPDEPRPMLPCMPSTISRRNAVSAAARVTCQLWRSPVCSGGTGSGGPAAALHPAARRLRVRHHGGAGRAAAGCLAHASGCAALAQHRRRTAGAIPPVKHSVLLFHAACLSVEGRWCM